MLENDRHRLHAFLCCSEWIETKTFIRNKKQKRQRLFVCDLMRACIFMYFVENMWEKERKNVMQWIFIEPYDSIFTNLLFTNINRQFYFILFVYVDQLKQHIHTMNSNQFKSVAHFSIFYFIYFSWIYDFVFFLSTLIHCPV